MTSNNNVGADLVELLRQALNQGKRERQKRNAAAVEAKKQEAKQPPADWESSDGKE